FGCKEEAPPPAPPAPVEVAFARMERVPRIITAVGRADAPEQVTVKPQVSGTLTAVEIEDGDRVQKGQRMFEIDPRPFVAALRDARANLARDRAQARVAAHQVRRYAKLLERKYIS